MSPVTSPVWPRGFQGSGSQISMTFGTWRWWGCQPHAPASFTYLLTPWSRVLLEKLTGSAASQEIPRIFGTRRFLTVLTSARHLSLSWANSIHSSQLRPTSWRSILILSSHLRLGLPNGPASFTPNKCFWYSFSLGAESTPGPWYGRKEYVTEKSSDAAGNRSRDRPTSSAAS
jgi:hypothetical protein